MSIIRDYRMQNKLSQLELAQKVGVHRGTISQWEKCHRYPKLGEMDALSRVTGLSATDIYNDIRTHYSPV